MKKTDLQMRGQKIGMALAMVLAVLLLLFPVRHIFPVNIAFLSLIGDSVPPICCLSGNRNRFSDSYRTDLVIVDT